MNRKHIVICLLACLNWTQLQANNQKFVTIIGPDGFPLVVPMEPAQGKTVVQAPEKAVKEIPTQEKAIQKTVPAPVLTQAELFQSHPTSEVIKETSPPIITSVVETPSVKSPPKVIVENKVVEAPVAKAAQIVEKQPFTLVDGEKYYDSEYLESKEFNLEEKSRFYQIPMSAGGGNWDVVERTKGVDMSWFNLRDQQTQQTNEVVALGKDYQVISSDLLQQALPVSCVSEKALKNAKDFKERSVSFWPRAPFNDEFDFELAALGDRKIQNIRLSSFVKNDKDKRYYWPMVVFLDGKGCIVEGATGYFTQAYAATMLQTESIEGVLHIPNNTKYILLTPLEAAVDLPEKQLSNHGQITLTVLR